jgi:hypothetical protein
MFGRASVDTSEYTSSGDAIVGREHLWTRRVDLNVYRSSRGNDLLNYLFAGADELWGSFR